MVCNTGPAKATPAYRCKPLAQCVTSGRAAWFDNTGFGNAGTGDGGVIAGVSHHN